jgi:hypothetical protein
LEVSAIVVSFLVVFEILGYGKPCFPEALTLNVTVFPVARTFR